MICSCLFILFILLTTILGTSVTSQVKCHKNGDDFHAAQIILFFAPMGESSAIRQQIAIYYHNPAFILGDEIHIYQGYEEEINLLKLRSQFRPTKRKGVWKTNIAPKKLFYNINTIYTTQCLGYLACWSRNGTSHTLRCLSTHPDWMGTRKPLFGKKRIQDIFIPGTHNSGSYSEAEPQSYMQQLTVTQDHDVFQQLIAGARYIDLRPSIYNGKYWVNHGHLHPMNRMDDIMNDVIQFINNTDEIVILSFKEFPRGFYSLKDHDNFITYLREIFANYLLPMSDLGWEITLEEMWDMNRRVILSYDAIFTSAINFWPIIRQDWPNAQDIESLRIHLINSTKAIDSPVAVMAELTLNSWTVVKNMPTDLTVGDNGSLRRLGGIVGPLITEWYYELFYPSANIVVVDYIDATGIVDVAIQWNERRFSSCYEYYQMLMMLIRNDKRN